MTLADRLRDRMAHASISQAELARRVGVAQPTIAKLVTGTSRASTHLHRIARELETTPAYLTGETDDPAEGAQPLPTLGSVLEQFGQVMVPLVDLGDALGTTTAASVRFEPFRRERLGGLMARSFTDLFACEMDGDAMLPTLRPGELVLVDRAQAEIREHDRLWVVAVAGIPVVRRVRRSPGGRLRLMADNPVVGDVDAAADEVEVVGRVVWRGGAI